MDQNTEKEWVKVGLDHDDAKLLKQLASVEKLSRADVIRRAIRAFAKSQLNQESPQSKVA